MRAPVLRPARLGLTALAALVLALGACGEPSAPAEQPTPSAPASTIEAPTGTAGSDGLTVRYLDHGTVKTVRVEDFPR